jgi:hypothetical protein
VSVLLSCKGKTRIKLSANLLATIDQAVYEWF